MPEGREHRRRNREIESRAGFSEVRRREVDDDTALRKVNAEPRERRPHAHATLTHGGLRKPNELEARNRVGGIDFDTHEASVEPCKGHGVGGGNHTPR